MTGFVFRGYGGNETHILQKETPPPSSNSQTAGVNRTVFHFEGAIRILLDIALSGLTTFIVKHQ